MEQENIMSESSGQLLAKGKRCLAAGDANGAVECFQEACGLLATAHGQVSIELAEPYYLYGKALLELARGNSSVLGSAIPVPKDKPLSDDEGCHDDDQPPSSGQANGENPTTADNNEQNEESERDKENEPVSSTSEESSKNEDAPCNKEVASSNDGEVPITNEASGNCKEAVGREVDASGDDGEAPTRNEEEDESDLQIAWEVLELARVICQKVETDEYRLKLSDVNLVLGEIGLESDQYEQAILDIQSSLQLRQFVLKPNDRRIAEVYFSLGLAYTLNQQFTEAIDAYEKSKETLQQRKAELESQLSSGEGDISKEKVEAEIKELSELLPDIDSKIADVGEMKRVMENQPKEEEGETTVGFGNNEATTETPSNAAPPVTDISHLVRKRTRNAAVLDEAVSSDEPSAKRPCPPSPPPPPTSSITEEAMAGSKGNLEMTDSMVAVSEQASSIKDISVLKEKSEATGDITSTVPEQ